MFNNIFTTKKEETKFVPKKYVLFNIETFNTWFNDKDNGAIYAHSGIFLRTDKLSIKQIEDYLLKCHNVLVSDFDFSEDIQKFYKEILTDWRNKLKE
jgi:hypothetical protein